MNHKAVIDAMADEHGWEVHHDPEHAAYGITEYRKRNGRKVAYVRVMFGVLNQVVEASWADNVQGYDGRQIGHRHRGKREWVLDRLVGAS